MFAVIFVPNFALQSLLRCEPDLRGRAVALIDAEGTNIAKTFVLECTPAAANADVSPGLTAPQAQARCRELILKPRGPSAEKNATEILIQTACAFSPNVENTTPGVCTIDLRGLNFTGVEELNLSESAQQQSFGFFQKTAARPSVAAKPVNDWALSIISTLQRLGLESQVGIASTPAIALLTARAAKPLLCIECVDEFFNTLPFTSLEPTPQAADIVKRWGIRTAGAFLALGREAISERLGAEALELFHRTSTQTIRPLNIVVPADIFEEQMDFEAHIETIEPLLFALRRFVEQLSTRIALTYRVVGELTLTLTLESGAPCQRTFKVPAPTANVETLFRMLHTHLENLRTNAPIQSLHLTATPVRSQGQQFRLFESALRDPNHFHETLARLTALLGADRVGTPVVQPSHHPDAFRMQTPDFAQNHFTDSTEEHRNPCSLCLRRFRPTILADVELRDGRPAFISSLRVNGRIVDQPRGPWCTSGEWWDQRRWMRQEWDVEMSDGAMYRLFYAKGNWSIEGVYD